MVLMEWAHYVAGVSMAEANYSYEIVVVKCESKRPLERPKTRWKNNLVDGP